MKIWKQWRRHILTDEESKEIRSHSNDSRGKKAEFISANAWRQAFETIKKELEYPTNLNGIVAFIDEELDE